MRLKSVVAILMALALSLTSCLRFERERCDETQLNFTNESGEDIRVTIQRYGRNGKLVGQNNYYVADGETIPMGYCVKWSKYMKIDMRALFLQSLGLYVDTDETGHLHISGNVVYTVCSTEGDILQRWSYKDEIKKTDNVFDENNWMYSSKINNNDLCLIWTYCYR